MFCLGRSRRAASVAPATRNVTLQDGTLIQVIESGEPVFIDAAHDPFCYQHILQIRSIISGDFYTAKTDNPFFIYFSRNRGQLYPGNGWKLHVSVQQDHQARQARQLQEMFHAEAPADQGRVDDGRNIALAWNAVKDIIIRYNISESKVVNTAELARFQRDEEQRDKLITIYCDSRPQREWHQIVHELEVALQRAGLQGIIHSPLGDKRIQGSQYISYRNDYDRQQPPQYVSARQAVGMASRGLIDYAYNPSGQPNPFEGFAIELGVMYV